MSYEKIYKCDLCEDTDIDYVIYGVYHEASQLIDKEKASKHICQNCMNIVYNYCKLIKNT